MHPDEPGASSPAVGAAEITVAQLTVDALGAGLMTLFIVAAGTLGEQFAGGNIGLAMLMTCLAGACGYAALARALGGVAPAGFNPAVALAFLLAGRLALLPALFAAAAQIGGAFLGVMIAHLVTNMSLVQVATQVQTGPGVWAGEFVGTALFVFVVLAATRTATSVPGTTGAQTGASQTAFIGAAALLAISLATPSLSFANPAITLARTLTNSFTAIRLEDGAVICAAQFAGAVAAFLLAHAILRPETRER